MAAEDRSRDTYTAALIPWRLTATDLDASSSYSQDDPMPGEVVSSATPAPRLQVQAYGDQSATVYNLLTQQGGNATPGGAAFVWKTSTDSATSYRGWDAPNMVASHTYIDRASSTVDILTPDCAAHPSGGVVVVASYTSSLNTHVRSYRLASDGTVTEVNVTGGLTDPTTRLESSLHPTVCVMPDESILIAHLVEDTSTETAQVNVYRSTDDGATYTLVSSRVLPEAIDVDNDTAGDGYTIRRMKMRQAAGRVILLVWMQVNNSAATSLSDGYLQLASDSEGLRFDVVELALTNDVAHSYAGVSQVDLALAFGYPDLTTLDDELYLAYIDEAERSKFRRLRSPFEAISDQSGSNVVTGYTDAIATISGTGDFTDGECAITSDTDGSIYVTHRSIAEKNMIITRTDNKGDSWVLLGEGISVSAKYQNSWRPGSNLYPEYVSMCASGGRVYVYGNHQAPTTTDYESSISEWGLGGWSSVTLAGNVEFSGITGRSSWAMTYYPGELPGNLSEWTKTTSGTATESLTADGLNGTASGTGTLYYTHTHTSTTAEGLTVEWVQQQTAGGSVSTFFSGASGFVEDTGAGYNWQVRVSTTAARMHDVTAGSTVSGFADLTLSADDVIEYRVEMRGSAIQGWYRVYSVFDDRLWTSWGSGTLTSTGGSLTPTREVTFGVKHSSASPVTTPDANFLSIRASYEEMNGTRSLPLTNPDDLFAHDYTGIGRAITLDGNYRINAVGGPGRAGDSYTGSPRYGYPVDLLHWPDSLSPREQWRSDAGASASPAQSFVYQISDQNELTRQTAAIGVFLGGIRGLRTGSVKLLDTFGIPTTYNFDLTHTGAGFDFTRNGNTVRPSSAGTSGVTLHRNEAMGWWLYLDSGSTQKWVQVDRNTEGVLAGGAGMPTYLSVLDVPSSCPTTGTAYLVPSSAMVIIHLQSKNTKSVQITLDSQSTPDNRATLGCLWVGDVYAFPDGPELGARYTTTNGTDISDSDARVTTTTRRAPVRREFELGWTAPAFTGAGEGDASDPNYSTATDETGALPMGLPDLLPYTVEGLYRYCEGSERPLVILRHLPKQASGSQVRVMTSQRTVIPAIITGNISIRDLAGVPGTTDQKTRGEALALQELV
jgi:hypothetical protein